MAILSDVGQLEVISHVQKIYMPLHFDFIIFVLLKFLNS